MRVRVKAGATVRVGVGVRAMVAEVRVINDSVDKVGEGWVRVRVRVRVRVGLVLGLGLGLGLGLKALTSPRVQSD